MPWLSKLCRAGDRKRDQGLDTHGVFAASAEPLAYLAKTAVHELRRTLSMARSQRQEIQMLRAQLARLERVDAVESQVQSLQARMHSLELATATVHALDADNSSMPGFWMHPGPSCLPGLPDMPPPRTAVTATPQGVVQSP